MNNNFRALCADLIEAVLSDDSHIDCTEIARRARAALGEADEPVMPEGKNPTRDELWELWLRLNNELPDKPAAVAAFWEHAQINARARAALAKADEPAVPEGREPAAVITEPSDEEWDALVERVWDKYQTVGYQGERFMYDGDFGSALDLVRKELSRWGHQPAPPADGEVAELVRMLTGIAHWRRRGRPGECDPSPFDIRQADRLDRAAELLERLSPPQPPADGEVAELVAELQSMATDADRRCRFSNAERLSRAAELLQRQVLVPVLVPVGERPWEREEWCDPNGLCWLGSLALDGFTPTWLFGPPAWAERFPNVHRVLLPAHALPLPEVNNG